MSVPVLKPAFADKERFSRPVLNKECHVLCQKKHAQAFGMKISKPAIFIWFQEKITNNELVFEGEADFWRTRVSSNNDYSKYV